MLGKKLRTEDDRIKAAAKARKKKRKKMINTHWGGVVEDNSFGTHEYMELCRQIGCKTYVNGLSLIHI